MCKASSLLCRQIFQLKYMNWISPTTSRSKVWTLAACSLCAVTCRWPLSPQLGPTVLPLQSDCLMHSREHADLGTPLSWESMLTLPMEKKKGTGSMYPDLILTSLLTHQNNFLKTYFLDQQDEDMILFLFSPLKTYIQCMYQCSMCL